MATLRADNSLTQGGTFADMTRTLHGGRRNKNRRQRQMGRQTRRQRQHRQLRQQRQQRQQRQRGGSAPYPGGFSETLPQDLHQLAYVSGQDAAFAALPQFAGKYGMSGGSRRHRSGRRHRGGSHLMPALVSAPSMILTAAEEPAAMLNPQWYTENQVVPSFQGPNNAYAAQATAQYAKQIDYQQKAGRRQSRRRQNRQRQSRRHRQSRRN